jgi:hypothetical protein
LFITNKRGEVFWSNSERLHSKRRALRVIFD